MSTSPKSSTAAVAGAGALVGLASGLVIAHAATNDLKADEFEALGTWVGAAVTIAALALAFVVHRRDVAVREADEAARQVREFNARRQAEELAEATRRVEADDAAKVELKVGFGTAARDGGVLVDFVNIGVINRAGVDAADVDVRLEPAGDGPVGTWLSVAGHSESQVQGSRRLAIPVPVQNHNEIASHLEPLFITEFTMHDARWRRCGSEPPRRLPDPT